MKIFKCKKSITFRRAERITYTAVLAAIAVVLNIIELNLGIGDIKLSLSYLPSFISGIFLGPLAGLSVGLLGDVVGVLIMPQGPWIPLVTLSSALMGFIPGLIFMIKKVHPFIKLAISLVLVFFICTAGFNSLGIFLVYVSGKKAFVPWWTIRMASQAIVVSINAAILFAIYYPFDKLIFARLRKTNITNDDLLIISDGEASVDTSSNDDCENSYSNNIDMNNPNED